MAIQLIFIGISIVISILFGANTLIMARGMQQEIPVSLGLIYRSVPAIPFIIITSVLIWGQSSILMYFDLKIVAILFLTSLMLTTGDYLLMYGLKHYPIRTVVPAMAINPIITMIWLVGTGIEKITTVILIGTIITIVGVIIVTFQQESNINVNYNSLYGVLIGFSISIIFGSMIYFDLYILSSIETNGFTYNGMKIIGVFIIGSFIFASFPKYRKSYINSNKDNKLNSLKYMLLSGVIGWIIGASLMFYTLDKVGAAIPIPIINMHPMLSIIFSSFLGFGKLNRNHGFGIFAVILGTVILAI